MHSDQVKAIEYPDGWGIYVLDGVVLEEELWKKILSGKMTFKEIMAIYRDWETDRKSTRLNSSHSGESRMPSSA